MSVKASPIVCLLIACFSSLASAQIPANEAPSSTTATAPVEVASPAQEAKAAQDTPAAASPVSPPDVVSKTGAQTKQTAQTGQTPSVANDLALPDARPGMGVTVGPVELKATGYLRAPLRLAFRSRGDGLKEGEGQYNLHTPWLVDDDYFRSGFQYLRTQESDWSEIYFSAQSKYLSADVALMGSLFTDWARPLLDRQWGIAQGSVTFRYEALGPRLRFRMHIRAGSFWDRFGWLENYDTYVFGRTHQMGGQVRFEFETKPVTFWLLQGVGAHLDAIEANQGLTLLNYLHVGASLWKVAHIGLYFLDTLSQDKRQLKEVQDASMRVWGMDLRLTPFFGNFYVAGSWITSAQAQYLSPVLEVMHSWGGRGFTENYLGTDKSDGTGGLKSLAGEYTFSLRRVLGQLAPERASFLRGGDVQWRFFGLVAQAASNQVDSDPALNRDGKVALKWGTELLYQPLSFVFASLRYDRVIIDVQDDAAAFRVLTPRIGATLNWMLGAQIFLQYSRYFYGDRVRLRPGQVALETLPDADVVKLQAQVSF
jgi:hypothetical protein